MLWLNATTTTSDSVQCPCNATHLDKKLKIPLPRVLGCNGSSVSERAPGAPLAMALVLRLISTTEPILLALLLEVWLGIARDPFPTCIRRFPETAPTVWFFAARFSWITFRRAWCRMMLYRITTTTIGRNPSTEVRSINSGGAANMNQQRRPLFVSPRQPKAGRNPMTIPGEYNYYEK